ncbi:MAG: pyridoxamine 5'-phosphate oxidase family protein [Azospirillaceae bacterium]
MAAITTIEALEACYGAPVEASLVKEVDRVTPEYARLIEASPFVVLATVGPEGLDCSPRGDFPGFVRLADERTLMMPDRKGNNRTDSLRNIVRDPRVALLFLLPGSGTTLRVNGRARVDDDEGLRESFAVSGQVPRTVIVMAVETVYFQCARAVVRADLWNPERHIDPSTLPSAGAMLSATSGGRVGGKAYDETWPDRAKASLW